MEPCGRRVPGKRPTAEFGEGDDLPVYWVNFNDAETFCRTLTERALRSGALPKGCEFRLPTEAQWEYACRAGTVSATSFGDQLGRHQANFKGEPFNGGRNGPTVGRSARVGSYPANPWGIYDMHGNIFEWCRDWYHPRLPGGTDPDLDDVKGTPNRDGTVLARSARGRLDRGRLDMPVRIPLALRTRTQLRPHWLSRRRGSAVRNVLDAQPEKP